MPPAEEASIREVLETAYDAGGGGGAQPAEPPAETAQPPAPVDHPAPVEPAAQAAEAPVAEPTEKTSAAGRDEHGRFTAKPKETSAAAKPTAKDAPSAKLAGQRATGGPPGGARQEGVLSPARAEPPATPPPDAAEPLRAPQSWKPAAREKWSGLPEDIKSEVLRVDREVRAAMQESAEAKRSWQAFRDVVSPFEGMIRAEGGEPLRAVASLLQTAAALRTAAPGHKAQLIASIVRSYGVPIDALDQALAGQAPGVGAGGAPGGGELRDPRFDQFLAQLEASKAQRQQELATRLQKELADFAQAHEFFEDVRADMARLVRSYAEDGVSLSLDDAYQRAVRMNPELAEVLRQREAAKAANASQASTQRAATAAASVKSTPSGATGGEGAQTVRAALEAAYSAASGR